MGWYYPASSLRFPGVCVIATHPTSMLRRRVGGTATFASVHSIPPGRLPCHELSERQLGVLYHHKSLAHSIPVTRVDAIADCLKCRAQLFVDRVTLHATIDLVEFAHLRARLLHFRKQLSAVKNVSD